MAALLSAALIVLLWNRTASAELAGVAATPNPGFTTSEARRQRPPPDRAFLYIRTRNSEADYERAAKALFLAGISTSVAGEGRGEEWDWIWTLEVPEEFAREVQAGDEVVLSAQKLILPGDDGHQIRHVRFRSRRVSVGEAENWRFLAAWGGIAGGPIVLWGIAALIAALCGKSRQPTRE